MDDKNSNVVGQSLPIKCPFYSRIGHRAVKIGEQVLIIGGAGPFGEFLKPVLRFNLENFKTEVLSNSASPNLQGFSSFTYKDTVYLWGGHLQSKPCNTLWSFQGANFDICAQNGQIPSPRAFHNSAFIAGRYLLIYGGFNETETFNDWFILDIQTFTWNRVVSNRQLPRNVKFELIWEHGRGFLVSECQVFKTNSKACAEIKNQFFQIRMISFTNYKLRIDQIESFEGQIPQPRSNFSLLFVEKQLWMLGGEIFDQNQSMLCNDIWALNIETLAWNKKSMMMSVKTGFQAVVHKNKIYLIGGIRSTVQMSGIVEIIHVKNNNLVQTQVCNFCKSVFNIDQKNYLFKPNFSFQIQVKDPTEMLTQISTNFLSKLAHFLQNPIQAVGLLIDNSLNMGSSLISIKLHQPILSSNYFKESQPYLYIGDNSKSFSSQQITRILFSFRFKVQKYYRDHIDKEDVKMRNQYGLNLKLASLRLGNSCLFVTTTTQDQTFVAYFSDCQTDCPDGDPSFNCFHYTITKDGLCSNFLNRQIIRENLRHLIQQKNYLNCSTHSTKVYVFNLYDLTKYQIQKNKFDIVYVHSQGTSLFSLSQYASSLYLTPFLGRQIYIEENRISFTNLLWKFKQDQKNSFIQQIDTTLQQNIFSKICLYKIVQNPYLSNCVYIYHQNRLITTVYSREKSICGFIQIPDLIQVDFFKSRIEKLQDERKMLGYIQSKQEPRKRQRRQNYNSEDKIRKIKPNYSQF